MIGLALAAAIYATRQPNVASLPNLPPSVISTTIQGTGSGTTTKTLTLPDAGTIRALLNNPNLSPASKQALEQLPVTVTFGATVTPPVGTDPVASGWAEEYNAIGIGVWKWTVYQGFNDNGSVVTNVAPANQLTQVWGPGWSLSNENDQLSAKTTGVWSVQSTNNAVFTYSPYNITTVETNDVHLYFTFYGNGNWAEHGIVTTS